MARIQQILLMLIAVVIVGCGKKEEGKPQTDAKTLPNSSPKEPALQTKPKEPTEAEKKKFAETKAKAEAGTVYAQWLLGVMYKKGEGVEQDFKEAVKWYRKAADQGDAMSQLSLGLMYKQGQGVGQDFKEAVKWYRKAADHGYVIAQNTLGGRYDFGEGVPEDDATAYAWYNIAATNGDAPAKKRKDSIAKAMTPDQIAKAEALSKKMIKNNPKLLKKKE